MNNALIFIHFDTRTLLSQRAHLSFTRTCSSYTFHYFTVQVYIYDKINTISYPYKRGIRFKAIEKNVRRDFACSSEGQLKVLLGKKFIHSRTCLLPGRKYQLINEKIPELNNTFLVKHIIFKGKELSKFKKNFTKSIIRKINQKGSYLKNEGELANLNNVISITKLQKVCEIGKKIKYNLHFKCDATNINYLLLHNPILKHNHQHLRLIPTSN